MKKLGIIYQSNKTNSIIDFQITEKKFSEFETGFIDCDLDSVILQTDVEINPNLKQIDSAFEFESLFPVITVDEEKKILMQAFLNQTALEKSFQTGFGHYFSRSRNSLWFKGETSHSTQEIKKILLDKEKSFFVYQVKQNLAACHEGYYSCFYRKFYKTELSQIDFKKII